MMSLWEKNHQHNVFTICLQSWVLFYWLRFATFFVGDLGTLKSRKQWLWGPTPHFLLVAAPPNPFDRMVKTMRLRTKVLIVSERLPMVSISVSKTKKGASNSKLYTDDPANHVAKFTDKQKADASSSCETSVFFVCICSQSRHSCHQNWKHTLCAAAWFHHAIKRAWGCSPQQANREWVLTCIACAEEYILALVHVPVRGELRRVRQ